MKIILVVFINILFLAPNFSFASTGCLMEDYTIATINGVFVDDFGARQNMRAIKDRVGAVYNGQKINYQYLLNPSHVAGLGDLAVSAYQKYFEEGKVEDYDLVEMRMSAAEKINTRKVLLVAHSQGNFYANSFYDSLVGHIPDGSMGVYAVATPASRVAGGGGWLTSDTDKVIAGLVSRFPGRSIMKPNTHIDLGSKGDRLGHSFADVYLKYRGDKMVLGIERGLSQLKAGEGSFDDGPCLPSSPPTFAHRVIGATLFVVDPVANVGGKILGGLANSFYNAGALAFNTIGRALASVQSIGQSLAGQTVPVPVQTTIPAEISSLKTQLDMTPAHSADDLIALENPQASSMNTEVSAIQNTPAIFLTNESIGDVATTEIETLIEPTTSVAEISDLVPTSQIDTNTISDDGSERYMEFGIYESSPIVFESTPLPDSYEIKNIGGGGTQSLPISTVSQIQGVVNISNEPADILPLTSSIVINEVAWGGTPGRPEDEWIELYNRSSRDIDLDGFTLYSKTDGSPYIRLAGIIPARGFFLIEAKNSGETDEALESSVKDITADLWTSFGARLNNNGEHLVLDHASTTVDEIPFCNNWCGVPSSKTTERYSPDEAGNTNSSWSANNGVITNGVNASGTPIIGTPKARNSLNHLIGKGANIISADITLSREVSPYIINDITQRIAEGATLNIEPGVVIKFRNAARLLADGNIVANGTADLPIVFTAFSDDEYGGDLDRSSVIPAKGSWFGVELSGKSTRSSFVHNIFRYGGNYGSGGLYRRAMLYVENSSPRIAGSRFESSKVYGLYLNGSNSVVSGNIFKDNSGDNFSRGIYINQGAPEVSDNDFVLNKVGVYSASSEASIFSNRFSSNQSAMTVAGPIGRIYGNSGGVEDRIDLIGSISMASATTTLLPNQIPYFLSGTVTIPADSILDIKEGTVIQGSTLGSPSILSVFGKLNIETPTTTGVIFSSNESAPRRGAWLGIIMNNSSQSKVKGATVRDALVGIKYSGSPIDLEDVIFSSNTVGVQVLSSPSVRNSANIIFFDNGADKNPLDLW